jgi:PDZ domain
MISGFSLIVTCLLALATSECGRANEPERLRQSGKSGKILAQTGGVRKQTSEGAGQSESPEPANAESGKSGGRKSRSAGAPSESPNAAKAEPGKTGGRKARAVGADFETTGEATLGLRVKNIEENGPADVAGLKTDDVVVSADGRPFQDVRQLEAYLSAQAGRSVPIVVDRSGRQLTMQVQPQVSGVDFGWLGVQLDEVPSNSTMPRLYLNGQNGNTNTQVVPTAEPAKGAVIADIAPDGPASRAGLRPGDIITSLNGKEIRGAAELVAGVYEMKPNSKAELTIRRNNQTQKISLTLGNRKQEMAAYGRLSPGQGSHFAGQTGLNPQGKYGQQGQASSAGTGAWYGGQYILNGSHMQQWQQPQPWNNWYQGHGNWGNGQAANATGNWAGSESGAAAAGWGAAGLGAAGRAAATVPGWGLGSAYYDSGYGLYYNPYYSGDDGSSGYDYSQPVQYNAPSQSPQGDGSSASGSSNVPTASEDALQHSTAARTAFRDQDYSTALSEANLALAKMPGDPGLHEFRALVLFALGQYKPAAAAMHSILAVGPGWNWTTLIGLYGDDTATYTKQLRALESDTAANPDSSADRFLLAYQYLCCDHIDAAARQLKKVIELTPKDQLAPQLLATITKSSETSKPSAPAAPAASTEKPLTASALIGDWTSHRDDGSTIEIKFTNDSKFTWIFTVNGKTRKFSGTAADANGLLALQRDDGTALMAHVTSVDGGGFRFRLVGGPPNDPGLVFRTN